MKLTTKEIQDLINYHACMMFRIGTSEDYQKGKLQATTSYTSHLDKKFNLEKKLRAA